MSIPASTIVAVNPGVISAGGNSLSLNGLFLTQNALMPAQKVFNFINATAVGAFFGLASVEYALALIYFAGYTNSTIKPGGMLFAPFNLTARAGWLQSGSLASLTLAALQALTGTLIVTVDGTVKTSSTINLSAATSYSTAATLIAAAFTTGPLVTWNAVTSTFVLTSSSTGATSGVSFATGTLAANLNLSATTGAVLSAGDTIDTPSTAMNKAVAITQNFATIVTLWEPTLADKANFAIWNQGQNAGQNYAFLPWDTDAQAIMPGSTTAFGVVAKAAQYTGVMCISGDPNVAAAAGVPLATMLLNIATFVSGAVASINFAQTNGRITAAFKSQGGLAATVANAQIAANLLANGYSFYGSYATANQGFVFFYNGQTSGVWKWLDTFVDQIYLNSQFQLALMILATQVGSIDYEEPGYSLVRSALLDPINAALNFGAIRIGVTLSALEISAVNMAAGLPVDSLIHTQGYYLQILDPGATVRANRGTPVINFWYADGGAVQMIQMASIDLM